MRVLRSRKHLLPILTVALLGGCSSLIGLDGDYSVPPGSNGPCTPGATEPCYTGPEGSESAAGCHAGVHVCKEDGKGYGECLLEIAPASGAAACACSPGEEMPCYSGPMETAGVGVCKAGTATCKADGSGFDGCMGDVVPAVEHCDTSEDESCDSVTACEVAYRFAQLHGNNAANTGNAVAIDKAGNAWVTGIAAGDIDLGGGPLTPADPMSQGMDADVFLLELDPAGRHLFSARFGDVGDQVARSIAVDAAGNAYILGDFTGALDFGGGTKPLVSAGGRDIFIAAFSPDGKCLWDKSFGGMSDQLGYGITVDRTSGDLFLTGGFYASVDFGGGTITAPLLDIYVTRLKASDGSYVWAKHFGAAGTYQIGAAIAVDASGDVAIGGEFSGTSLNIGGTPQDALPCAGLNDIFVAKLKGSDGSYVWSKGYGDAADQLAHGVATDNKGNVFVAAHFHGTVDFGDGAPKTAGMAADGVILKLAPDTGATLWAKAFGSAATDETAMGITVDGAGNVVVLASSTGGDIDFGNGPLPSQGNVDFAIAKLDTMGKPFVARRFGGTGDQIGAAIAVDSLGRIVMTGNNLLGAPNFGGGPIQVGASRAILVAGFSP